MVSVCFWMAFGAVTGWVAAILQDETVTRRIMVFVVAGALGGLFGGFGGLLIDSGASPYRSSTADIIFAVFGASTAAFIVGMAADNHSSE